MLTFNMADGYAEAVVKGFRSGFLTDDEYHHLTQCETIEGEEGRRLGQYDCPFVPASRVAAPLPFFFLGLRGVCARPAPPSRTRARVCMSLLVGLCWRGRGVGLAWGPCPFPPPSAPACPPCGARRVPIPLWSLSCSCLPALPANLVVFEGMGRDECPPCPPPRPCPPSPPADIKMNLQETDYGNFLQSEVRGADLPSNCMSGVVCARVCARLRVCV